MEAGIVGLPNVGKSTLFNALTAAGIASENYPFCTIEPNIGAVPIPDPRLTTINKYIETRKNHSRDFSIGRYRWPCPRRLAGRRVRQQIPRQPAERRRYFARRSLLRRRKRRSTSRAASIRCAISKRSRPSSCWPTCSRSRGWSIGRKKQSVLGGPEAKRRLEILKDCQSRVNEGKPVRSLSYDEPTSARILRELQLLTSKRVLYVANVGEKDLEGGNPMVEQVQERAAAEGSQVVRVAARLEAEIAELDESDRAEMLQSVGLAEPALAALARSAYRLLGLQSYYTAGPKEIRAWTIPTGATRAAGRRRDPHRFRARFHPGRSVRGRRPRGIWQRKGDSRSRQDAIGGQILRHAGQRCLPLPVQLCNRIDESRWICTRATLLLRFAHRR